MGIKTSEPEFAEFAQATEKLDRKQYKAAYNLFIRAAEHGNALALNSVGYMLDRGLGVRRQPALAMNWYRKAARAGDAIGCTNLGLCYQNLGKSNLALKWIRRAARIGDADAALDLGKELLERKDAVSRRRAKVYLKIAASSPYLDAEGQRAVKQLLSMVSRMERSGVRSNV